MNDRLTTWREGVVFDIDADGQADRVSWTTPFTDVGFLVMDRNGNGSIDDGKELFGASTPKADGTRANNGFEALKDLDSNGDGAVDPRDAAFTRLRIWRDDDHDGRTVVAELQPLTAVGVVSISTEYHTNKHRDNAGNRYKYEGTAIVARGQTSQTRRVFDVVLNVGR